MQRKHLKFNLNNSPFKYNRNKNDLKRFCTNTRQADFYKNESNFFLVDKQGQSTLKQ